MFRKYRSNSTNNARHNRSNSTSDNGNNNISPVRRFSQPNLVRYEILHSTSSNSSSSSNNSSAINSDNEISPATSTNEEENETKSMLSETNTLIANKETRLELQETFVDNFTMYIPYLLRQRRLLEQRQLQEHGDGEEYNEEVNSSDDDTIIDATANVVTNYSQNTILNHQISEFDYKRKFIIVGGILKHNLYIFPSEESFKLFKTLRSNVKKERKNSIIVYDSQGNIKKANVDKEKERIEINDGNIIDSRSHLIPIDYKIKGEGLPILKMEMPYLPLFRKIPLFTFKKYLEIPKPPIDNHQVENEEVEFETTTICNVQAKFLQKFRRFIFEFKFDNNKFKVLMFQSNSKPFADFIYKNTRFRIIGPSITNGIVCKYNPHMRLLIVDNDQPSLCDEVQNKKSSSILKKHEYENAKFNINDFSTYVNPIPTSKFANEEISINSNDTNYISNNLPPFGCFKDSILYSNQNGLLPKMYSEVGKIEVYQDDLILESNPDSTFSVNIDSIVICCIFATLRETSIRNAGKAAKPAGFNHIF
ncbi:unnamed protein product [Candida verbasci]|uniref:Uncharacterized protein n=1 Tax=Candida verbasci TaxID=1227364 RepID=A0A9W4XAV0_9ASCO|nr:unnamed protein product [Candida verbasci]